MKIVVLIKQTFDSEEKVEVINGKIQEKGAKFVINPYDEYALEEAIRIKESIGAEVYAITVGPERSSVALRTALALGVDQAILVPENDRLDQTQYIAALLAESIKPINPDLILAGLFAIDSGSSSIALHVAELLKLPHASAAVNIRLGTAEELGLNFSQELARLNDNMSRLKPDVYWKDQLALVERDVEGDSEIVVLPLPALITTQQGLNEPRTPSLPGIMKSKKKAIIERFPGTLIDDIKSQALFSFSKAVTVSISPPPPRQAGRFLQGSSLQQVQGAAAIIQRLNLKSRKEIFDE